MACHSQAFWGGDEELHYGSPCSKDEKNIPFGPFNGTYLQLIK